LSGVQARAGVNQEGACPPQPGANGGSPGNAVTGNSNITWLTLGTRLGPIS
jgi:hypothetical protein